MKNQISLNGLLPFLGIAIILLIIAISGCERERIEPIPIPPPGPVDLGCESFDCADELIFYRNFSYSLENGEDHVYFKCPMYFEDSIGTWFKFRGIFGFGDSTQLELFDEDRLLIPMDTFVKEVVRSFGGYGGGVYTRTNRYVYFYIDTLPTFFYIRISEPALGENKGGGHLDWQGLASVTNDPHIKNGEEPDDFFEQATKLECGKKEIYSSMLPGNDVDFYTFTVKRQSSSVVINRIFPHIHPRPNQELMVELYDQDRNRLTERVEFWGFPHTDSVENISINPITRHIEVVIPYSDSIVGNKYYIKIMRKNEKVYPYLIKACDTPSPIY